MPTQSSVGERIDEIKDCVSASYTAVSTMGGTLPIVENIDNLADAILSIPPGATEPYIEETYDSSGNLTDAVLHGYTLIRQYLFYQCRALKNVTLPEGILRIGTSAFESSDLTDIVIPDSTTIIGDNAFTYCSHLNDVSLGDGLTTIGSKAFGGTTNLETITIPASVQAIGDQAFAYTGLILARFDGETPPALGSSQVFYLMKPGFKVLFPYQSTSYLSATNYPSPEMYPYIGFGTFAQGEDLPEGEGLNLSLDVDSSHFTSYDISAFETNDAGIKYVDFPNKVGGGGERYIETTITVSKEGDYEVSLMFDSVFGASEVQDRIKLQVTNLSTSTSVDYVYKGECVGTGHTFRDYHTNSVHLTAGQHKLKFTAFNNWSTLGGPVLISGGSSYTWYANIADAVTKTNEITKGNGNEVYCRY